MPIVKWTIPIIGKLADNQCTSTLYTGSPMSLQEQTYTQSIHTHTHTRWTALCPGLPRWASTRKVKPVWISLNQETVSGSGISWAIYKPASSYRQITTPATHHSFFTGQMPFLPPNSIKALKANAVHTHTIKNHHVKTNLSCSLTIFTSYQVRLLRPAYLNVSPLAYLKNTDWNVIKSSVHVTGGCGSGLL